VVAEVRYGQSALLKTLCFFGVVPSPTLGRPDDHQTLAASRPNRGLPGAHEEHVDWDEGSPSGMRDVKKQARANQI
jgi:hypothetical protein